jgi:hypothetical protein
MKMLIVVLTVFSFNSMAINERYFQRPMSCPLRFSQLSGFRDQVQLLAASLGSHCNQQAISQLNANVANLEGIANTFNNYNSNDGAKASTLYAKNLGQILGSINLITSNNSCFYDFRARGFLPVLSDIIMSTSQLGLLVPNASGQAVAAGGFIAGSGIKIINELLKKKFNNNKPEERRAFIQLNCAFFDNRRVMEESGIFNPETEQFREELVTELRRERLEILKSQKRNEDLIRDLDISLSEAINSIPSAKDRGLNPTLARNIDEILNSVGKRPSDYSEKLRQVSLLADKAPELLEGALALKLDNKADSSRKLLISNLEKIIPDLASGAKAWTNTIDEYEMNIRGPLFAFLSPVANALKKQLMTIEAEIAIVDPEMARKVSTLRQQIKANQNSSWAMSLRLTSIETKIASFERTQSGLFSENDEGSSNTVEILDYYRQLQRSILGNEGRDYLKNATEAGYNMQEGLDAQLELMEKVSTTKEKCSAAEKTRFAWTQYRYKVQEAHDFVATNMDLYRSSFRIGKERLKGSTLYVLSQMDSVQDYFDGKEPKEKSIGALMKDVNNKVKQVEARLQNSGCF